MLARTLTVLVLALSLVALTAAGAMGRQKEPGVTEELYGNYNFRLEISGSSGAVTGYFTECSGLGSESATGGSDGLVAPSAADRTKASSITLKRGTIPASDLEEWKAAIRRSGQLVLSRREGGRTVCRWELRSPELLALRGAEVRDGAELSLRALVSGGCR